MNRSIYFFLCLSIAFNIFAHKQSPSAILGDWESINNSITQQINSTFESTDNFRGLKKNDFDDWVSECKKLTGQFNTMLRSPNKKYSYDIEKWKDLNDQVHNAIKSGKFPGLNDSEKINLWKSKCDLFYDTFKDLKKGNTTTKNDNSDNKDDARSIIEDSKPSSNWAYPSSTNRMKKLQTENQKIKTSAEKAFDVCLLLPLAIMYDEDYVDCGYEAAKGLYEAGAITDPNMKADWIAFSPLLLSYGTYNNEVIRFLESHKKEIERNNGYVTELLLRKCKQNVYTLKYGKFYNDENVSIIYLDNVLNEYFDFLESKVKSQEPISERFYYMFISTKLDSNYIK